MSRSAPRSWLALTLILVCAVLTAAAQTSESPSKVPATAAASSADNTPQANPGRPTVTNPATLPPTGYLQFEQGYLGSLTSPATHTQYGYNEVAKIAVHPRLMLQVQSQPFAASTDYTAAPASKAAGAIAFGPQIVLFTPNVAPPASTPSAGPRKTPVPTVSVGYLHTFYAGNTSDIDYGSATNSFLLLFSGDFGAFHYDFNYIVNEQDGTGETYIPVPVPLFTMHTIRRAQYAQTLSINHPVFSQKLELSVELYHFTQPLVINTDNQFPTRRANNVDVLVAPSYTLRPNIVLDAGFAFGITNTSTRWQSFAGLTYLLPHKLIPDFKIFGH